MKFLAGKLRITVTQNPLKYKNMKNITKIVIVAALAAATLAACKTVPKVLPTFDAIDNEQNLPTTTGNFESKYHFEYLSTLADQAILQKIQLAMAAEMFGPEFAVTDAGASAAAYDQSVPSTWGIRSDSTAFHWDGHLHLTSTATLVGDNIVAYTVDKDEDSGGAHPMTETKAANWDLRTGDRLTLDALFTPEGKAGLGAAIRGGILTGKGLGTWEELVARDCFNPAEQVGPTENFILTATDITFVYNPYEIACYAAGATRVTLPLANLAGYKPVN
jgi:hypothetical protein